MFSYQFFHDCSFAPVNCPKKKKKRKKERTLALLLTTLFSNSVLCSHFLFSFSRSSCSFPVPCSPFPILVTSPYKQERMSRRKSDYKGCFIRLELLIIEKKKHEKEQNDKEREKFSTDASLLKLPSYSLLPNSISLYYFQSSQKPFTFNWLTCLGLNFYQGRVMGSWSREMSKGGGLILGRSLHVIRANGRLHCYPPVQSAKKKLACK